MWESINASSDFKVDPAVADTVGEVVLGDEFVRNVSDLDFTVFVTFERSLEVEIADVEGGKPGSGSG